MSRSIHRQEPEVDWSRTSDDYATYRAGFPARFFEELRLRGRIAPGMRALDVGTGTGTVALGLAARGAAVTAIDPSGEQLARARASAEAAGARVRFRRATAEATGLDDGAVELYTAGQAWHWFDRPAAAAEAHRVLVPTGTVVLAHLDYLDHPGDVVETTLRVIERHRPTTTGPLAIGRFSMRAFYGGWPDDLWGAGFRALEAFAFDVDLPYTREAWRGRIRASAWIGASLAPEEVEAFDRDLAAALQAFPPVLAVPHRVFAALGRKGGAA
ncbi:MAG: class I SAM-dependent methyltransferase [Sandaracinaceae bacterium]